MKKEVKDPIPPGGGASKKRLLSRLPCGKRGSGTGGTKHRGKRGTKNWGGSQTQDIPGPLDAGKGNHC